MALNLKAQNKLSFKIPQQLEELEYENSEEFKKFLLEKFEEFKILPANYQSKDTKYNKENTAENKKNESFSKNTTKNEEINNNAKSKEVIQVETKTNDETKTDITKEENKNNEIIRPRKNYISWFFGAGLTGLLGIGLFFMFSKKKY